jgi:hypothetical protein
MVTPMLVVPWSSPHLQFGQVLYLWMPGGELIPALQAQHGKESLGRSRTEGATLGHSLGVRRDEAAHNRRVAVAHLALRTALPALKPALVAGDG